MMDLGGLAMQVDTSDVTRANRELDKLVGASGRAEGAASSLTRTTAATGRQMKLTGSQAQQLGYQVNDFFVQVASGGSPLTALIQQGSQLTGTFGGIRPAIAAVTTLLTPLTVGLGLGAAAVGGLALAAYQGRQESKELQRALQLTGNAAGITRGQVEALALSISAQRPSATGDVREALQALVESGQFVDASLGTAGRAVLALQRISGESAADIAKDFGNMRGGVAQWAAEHNRAYNYLTAEQFKFIRSLETQGRTQEAIRANFEALAQTMESRTAPALGLLDRTLQGATDMWSKFWDAAKGIGRPETVDDQIAKLQERIGGMDAFTRKGGYGGNTAFRDATNELETLQRERARSATRLADQTAAQREQQDLIDRASRSFTDTLLGIDRAREAQQLAITLAGLDARQLATERGYRRAETNARAFEASMVAIEQARISAREADVRQQLAIESRRVIEGTGVQAEAQRNALTERRITLESRLVELAAQRRKLLDDAEQGKYRRADIGSTDTAASLFRQSELAQGSSIERIFSDRNAARLDAENELSRAIRDINLGLLVDDRARGLAQIAIEEQVYRERLGMAGLFGDRLRDAEDALGNWRQAKQRQLTEQLKPEWQKMLDGWRNTDQLMRDSNDRLYEGVLRNAEDAWVQLITTGRLNARTLVSGIAAEWARLEFRKFAGSFLGGGGNPISMLLSGLGSLTGGGGLLPGGVGAAPYAKGTNYVPEDNHLALLHKGEAVVPRRYNPAAGGTAPGGRVVLNLSQVINVDSRSDRAQIQQDVAVAMADGRRQMFTELQQAGVL